eukprot:1048241-Prymnesium_polylepis.1
MQGRRGDLHVESALAVGDRLPNPLRLTRVISGARSVSSSALRGGTRPPTATAGVWQKPPVRTPGRQKVAEERRASTRSQLDASCAPPAKHLPATEATVTCGTACARERAGRERCAATARYHTLVSTPRA